MRSLSLFLFCLVFSAALTAFLSGERAHEATPSRSRSSFLETAERRGEMEAGFAYEALEWQYRLRAFPAGNIPERWMETALGQMAALKSPAGLPAPSALTWLPVGPDNIGGRVRSIAIDPTNHNVIYAGTGEGDFNVDALRGAGILKSTDAGSTWALITTFGSPPAGFPYYINDIYIRPVPKDDAGDKGNGDASALPDDF